MGFHFPGIEAPCSYTIGSVADRPLQVQRPIVGLSRTSSAGIDPWQGAMPVLLETLR